MKLVLRSKLTSLKINRMLHGHDTPINDIIRCLNQDLKKSSVYSSIQCLRNYVELSISDVLTETKTTNVIRPSMVVFDVVEQHHGSLNEFKVKHNDIYINDICHRLYIDLYAMDVTRGFNPLQKSEIFKGITWDCIMDNIHYEGIGCE